MKNDITQKPGYETYWGQMTNYLKMNNFEYNSIKENLIKNLNADINGCKLNLIGSGAEGVSITYEKS